MESIIKIWKTSRNKYLDFLDKYDLEQLNVIPTGFNNNLVWNIGHIIVAQQSLIYKLSNLPMHISNDLLEIYKPGTKPISKTSQAEIDELKNLLTVLVDKTEIDLSNDVFRTFNERMTGTGFHLTSLGDAFEFNNYHEALHLGYMLSIKKFVLSSK
ncbi:MAG: DinB family protein [Ginsengibacter sp.]